MEEILHQLRLVVYSIVYKVLYISGGDRRISERSTVSFRWSFLLSSDSHLRRLACAESQLGAEHAGDLVTDLDRFGGNDSNKMGPHELPIGSMGRLHIYRTYICFLVMVNVGICTIHGSYGIINGITRRL